MEALKCPSCGASSSGLVCSYCGSQVRDTSDEKGALAEYHALLKSESGAQLEKLLQHGYLPESDAGLIEAGLACVPLLDDNLEKEGADPPHAAAKRLEAITSRLRISGKSPQAVAEFESHLKKFHNARTSSTRLGCAILLIFPALVIALLLWLLLG